MNLKSQGKCDVGIISMISILCSRRGRPFLRRIGWVEYWLLSTIQYQETCLGKERILSVDGSGCCNVIPDSLDSCFVQDAALNRSLESVRKECLPKQ